MLVRNVKTEDSTISEPLELGRGLGRSLAPKPMERSVGRAMQAPKVLSSSKSKQMGKSVFDTTDVGSQINKMYTNQTSSQKFEVQFSYNTSSFSSLSSQSQ